MRFSIFHIAFLIFFCSSRAQQPQDYNTILNKTDLPGKASAILLSQKGFFYVSTSEGLYLFNGVSLRPLLKKEDSIQNITALFETAAGELKIGCAGGMIYTFNLGKTLAWKPQEGLPQKAISGMAEDRNGNLWIATKGEGLYVYHQNKMYNFNTDDGLSDNYVYDVQLINNQIFAATDNGISICGFRSEKKFIKNLSAANGLTDNIVQTITQDSQNKSILWLGFQNGGLGKLNLSTLQSKTVYSNKTSAPVNKIFDGDNELWLAEDEGLTVLNRVNYLPIFKQAITNLSAIYADYEANLWLLSSTTIYKTSGEQLRLVLQPTLEENNQLHDLLVDDKGNYWLTSKAGVISYSNKAANRIRKYYPLPVKSNADIICLYQDFNGLIWAGTMGDGIYIIDPVRESVKHISTVSNLNQASILSITGNENHVWISALEGVWKCSVMNNYQFENLNTATTIGSTYIYYVLEDSKKRIWFATDGKGITMLENGTYKTFREKDGLKAKVIYSALEDRNGNIWFNTSNNGLYKFNGSSFKHLNAEAGLPDVNISAIALNNKGFIFCITQKESILIDPETDRIISLGTANNIGEINTDLNSIYSNGTEVFYLTSKGIFSYQTPAYSKINRPQTRILSVSLFLNELTDSVTNLFAYNENNLSFKFEGFYFTDPEKVQYQYKLEGYNNSWQFTKDGFVNFPKLQPATYTFKVRSSATTTFVNADEAQYKFTISKPFWKQWWFVLASVLIVTAILLSIIKAREKEVKKIQQLQTEKLKSQYETLKNQVNPHFLFNSFNTLLSVIDEDPAKAGDYVEHLSDFYRSIVNLREKDIISLGEELKIIEHYFFIQKKRFGNALNFNNPVTEKEKLSYAIPPLCLQLLMENAIKHNIVSQEKPLTITISLQHNWLVVENNTNEKITQEKGEGLGLQNIKNRFLLIAEKEVLIEKTKDHFIVKLPLIKLL